MKRAARSSFTTDGVVCELISWNHFYNLCRKLAFKVRKAGYHPDLMIAIARGGLLPARILADFFGLMNMTSLRIEHYRGAHKVPLATVRDSLSLDVRGKYILLVDDVSDSGDTFHLALEHIERQLAPEEIKTCFRTSQVSWLSSTTNTLRPSRRIF